MPAEAAAPLVWPSCGGETLPALTSEKIREAARSFPSGTGLGWDQIHPRVLLRCSDELVVALVRILVACESSGSWPVLVGVNMICLIPKSSGGLRPIGLMPMVVRLWMRVRLDVARAWQAHNEALFLCWCW